MSKTRAPYPPEFRQQMVELVRAGRSPEELAREFEPFAQAIRNWVSQADRDDVATALRDLQSQTRRPIRVGLSCRHRPDAGARALRAVAPMNSFVYER